MKNDEMIMPEYFMLFPNPGTITIEVRTSTSRVPIAKRKMNPEEITQLIHNGKFYTQMSFDEWPFEIYKYEIDPIKNKLIIKVRKNPLSDDN